MRSLLSLMAVALIVAAVGCNKADSDADATPASPSTPAATETSAKVDAPAEKPADASKGEVQTVSLNVPGMT